MKEMYWIDVLGNISTTMSIIAAITIIVCLIVLGLYLTAKYEKEDEEAESVFKRWLKRTTTTAIASLLIAIFTPSTKALYAIYGVGGTIDYIKSNETARQLPDKVVTALDKWVDSINDDKSTKNERQD